VGYGMHYAALLSRAQGGVDLTGHTRQFLAWQRPAPLPALDWATLLEYMARDKKADSASVRFVLLHDLAQPYLTRVPGDVLSATFAAWQDEVRSHNPV
jgi:3-dehydroquinate synthase